MGTSAFSYASFPWSKTSSRRSGGIVCDRRHCEATTICSKNARRLVRQQLAARPSVTTMLATESPSTSISSIKSRLRNAMEGLNFGLSIDADAEIMTEQEGEVCLVTCFSFHLFSFCSLYIYTCRPSRQPI